MEFLETLFLSERHCRIEVEYRNETTIVKKCIFRILLLKISENLAQE